MRVGREGRRGISRGYSYGALVVLILSAVAVIGLSSGRSGGQSSTGSTSSDIPASTASSGGASCVPAFKYKAPIRTQLQPVTFGAVTEFLLPSPLRAPNAITPGAGSSVWFGESALPGVGRLFENGTLVEYQWPFNYPATANTCSSRTNIWGIAVWDGRVWASDSQGNQLVGLDPVNGSVITVPLSAKSSYPYTLTVAPGNNSLWFTELFGSKLGHLFSNGTLAQYTVAGGEGEPTQIVFQNSTLGYFTLVERAGGGPIGCYSFDPQAPASSPVHIGGNRTLIYPNSIALGDGGFWLTEHGASNVVFYSLKDASWTTYPTSTVSYVDTTLPYFIATNGTQVWFNEHYGNRLAMLDYSTKTLTEYGLTDPPIENGSQIPNALTFALEGGRVWFTELTANYVGFVDPSAAARFTVSPSQPTTVDLSPGAQATLEVGVNGDTSQPLSVQFSTSEYFTAVPQNMTFTSSPGSLSELTGPEQLSISVEAASDLAPGRYTILVTVNGGLVLRGTYATVQVAGVPPAGG